MAFTWEGRQMQTATVGGSSIAYTYDVDGYRTTKTIDGVKTVYVLDGSKVIMEQTGSDSPIYFTYDVNGKPATMTVGSATYYYVYNLQGDVIAITNNNGMKVVEYTYDPWGKVLSTTGSLATTIGAQNPYRYRGYRYDTELGMYYLNSRYYDPETGRFINADGLASTGQGVLGYNMFAYCNNNPTNKTDSNGMLPLEFKCAPDGGKLVAEGKIEARYGEITVAISVDVNLLGEHTLELGAVVIKTTATGLELETTDGETIAIAIDYGKVISLEPSASLSVIDDVANLVFDTNGVGLSFETDIVEGVRGSVTISYKIEPIKVFFYLVDDLMNGALSFFKYVGAGGGGGSPNVYSGSLYNKTLKFM